MSITRRRVLALVGIGAFAWAASLFVRSRVNPRIASILEEQFGPEIAATPAARAFVADYDREADAWRRKPVPMDIVRAFLQSTSFVDHMQTGAALEYDGLFEPYVTPCMNRLAANWAPEGEHG